MLFIYDLFKKNGRARIFNYTGYLVEYVKTYNGDSYKMRIYKLYRYVNGVESLVDTFPSYKLWKQVAYDIGMPGMNDKTRYIAFQNWYNILMNNMNRSGMKEKFPTINTTSVWINGIEYNKLPDDKESPFMKYGGPFGPVREVISNGVREIYTQDGRRIQVGEDEEEEEEVDDIPF